VSVIEPSSFHAVAKARHASDIWLRFRRRRVTRELAGLGAIAPLMAGSRTWSRPASTDTRAWMQ
jgi:hypothetical protein